LAISPSCTATASKSRGASDRGLDPSGRVELPDEQVHVLARGLGPGGNGLAHRAHDLEIGRRARHAVTARVDELLVDDEVSRHVRIAQGRLLHRIHDLAVGHHEVAAEHALDVALGEHRGDAVIRIELAVGVSHLDE
jgi:hypothetical protein